MTGIYSAGYGANYAPMAKSDACIAPSTTAAQETAKLWGDPHIVAANGGKYDFQQTGIFNLLSDRNIELNGLLTQQKPGSKVTYDTEAGLTYGDEQAHFYADGRVDMGSTQSGATPVQLQDGQTYSFGSNATIRRAGDSYTVATPEYKIQVDTNKQDKTGQKHMNLSVSSGDQGVAADGVLPSGLLGETFNAAQNPQTAPENSTEAYQVNSLFSVPQSSQDCNGSSQSAQGNQSTTDEAPGDQVSMESASYIWQLADTNGDGRLDPTEIQTAINKLQDGNPQHEATARLMMGLLNGSGNGQPLLSDFNNDGGISLGELGQVASLDGDASSLSQDDLNRLQSFSQQQQAASNSYQPNGGTGAQTAPTIVQMLLQVMMQSLQVLSQLLQAGGLVR